VGCRKPSRVVSGGRYMKVVYWQPRSNDIRLEVISSVRESGSGSLRSATDDGGVRQIEERLRVRARLIES